MRITVRVTPRARSVRITKSDDGSFSIAVTAPPEHGKATDAARRALAEHLGLTPSRVSLIMGAASRTKVFEIR
jgi:hypothetical protein